VFNASYTAVLALDSGFTNIVSSSSISNNIRPFDNLVPSSTYYFKVKLSSENDAGYSPSISTRTAAVIISSPTNLSPYFTFISHNQIQINWTYLPTNFIAVLALDSNFTNIVDSMTVTFNNQFYSNLSTSTAYYFKVKVATEPDMHHIKGRRP
jgi:hypothetical protein